MGAYGVVGDPAGMRALAAVLRAYANDAGGRQAELAGLLAGITFVGPAGEAFRGRRNASGKRVRGAADQLTDAANLLVHAASDVEAEIERARREEERRERERGRR